ncbi:MAG: hypothetical protein HZA15_10560 [Nitrospirae bacterium]|nr:hypothetical protein [Nitrospirota bacterium]
MPKLTSNEIINFYSTHVKSVKPLGSGWYSGLCPLPGHDDQNASLNFNPDSGGFNCHGCSKSGSIKDFCQSLGLPLPFVSSPKRIKGQIVKTYDYINEQGTLLFQTVRLEPKDFQQRRPDGQGGWIWNLKGIERVLFNLSAVIQATDVIIVEGEKDADNLKDLGLVATTCPMGAGRWRSEYNKRLAGKHVAIIPDNDEPGREHAVKVAQALSGTAAGIKIVYLDGLPPKGDVSDWVNLHTKAGRTSKQIRIDLEDIIDATKEYVQTQIQEITPDTDDNDPLLVLGKTADGKILLYSKDTRITHTEDRRSLDRKALIDICGLEFVKQLEANPKTARASVQAYCDRLIDQARHTLTGSKEKRGQGLYKHNDESIMIVDGQDSYLLDRALNITEIDTPLFGKYYIEYSDLKWFNRDHIARAKTMTQEEASNILKELASTIDDRWTLKDEHDSDLLSFSMIASILQGIFSWRPHYYITGKRASGKTTLLKWMAEIWGPITLFREGKISEAGLRQDLCSDSRIIAIDEFEKNTHRQGITELLRTANHKDGGVVTKGTPGGKPLHFRIQSSAWLSSIEIGLNEAADRSRYIIFHFKGFKKGIPSISKVKELSVKTYALSLWLWSQGVDRLADEIRSLKDDRFTDRSHDNLAPLVAILALSSDRNDYKAIMNVLLSQNSEALIKNAVEDEQQLMDTILGSSLPIEVQRVGTSYPDKRPLTIAQVIESDDEEQWAQIERLGVKVLRNEGKNEDGYFVCLAQEPLKQNLLKGTKYEHLGLKEILERIPDAIYNQAHFAKVRRWNVRVPYILQVA